MPITSELFGYGSLRSKRLRRRLLGREIKTVPAWLEGFASVQVAGSPYPGLVRAPGQKTVGELLLGLRPRDLERLDRYEGTEYERRLVWVQAQGRKHRAWVYCWRDRRRLALKSRLLRLPRLPVLSK
nr:hypothetical conserved protein [uncultured Gammaproteobacteria bacterium]